MLEFIKHVIGWLLVATAAIMFLKLIFYREKNMPVKTAGEKGIINLPETFSRKELDFIENEYTEKGMQILLKAKGKSCKILNEPTASKNYKYVSVQVQIPCVIKRDSKTLKPVHGVEIKDIKLLLLNEWIK